MFADPSNKLIQMPINDILSWLGILACLSQSAMFSGLNLAFFSLGRLRLEAEAEQGNEGAQRILDPQSA